MSTFQVRGVPSVQYILHLRFRFYPTYVDFIKTPATLHALYLQLRRDVLDSRIEPRRDIAFDLAALALQAEFGDRPPAVIIDYFSPGHYLPPRFVASEDPARLRTILSELHSHYGGTKEKDAQLKFIEMCQRLPDYGCHSYRVFRSKAAATSSPSPFDADNGSALWIGIMPKGIVVSESQMGQRAQIAENPWQRTHTLQFDKKKFVIVDLATDADGERKQSVFYTDHHSKSAYYVRFAASQHRFMIKMRQWKNQLKSERKIASMPDVAAEGRISASPLDNAESLFDKIPSASNTLERRQSDVAPRNNGTRVIPPPTIDTSMTSSHDRSFESTTSTAIRDESMNQSHLDRLDETDSSIDGEILDLSIVKDPAAGLGLTLVDGHLNGIAGVYVKTVADGGAGQKSGLNVGDRILSVNGESLINKDRHRAVQLVKESSSLVSIQVSRIHGIVTQHKTGTLEMSKNKISAVDLKQVSLAALQPPKVVKGGSRTPPAPRKQMQKRTRAVSDFGALGDALPELNSEEIIADMKNLAGHHLADSDEETTGEYRLPQSTSLYGEGDDEGGRNGDERTMMDQRPKRRSDAYGTFPRRSNLDWADELEEVGEESEDEDGDIVDVSLTRNDNGSLGVQVASSEGKVRIQALTAKPALGHPDISEQDWLIAVNGVATDGKAHKDVVAMLRGGGDTVTLRLKKATSQERIRIVLDRSSGAPIGLSLAKRVACEGVFVRMIGAGSIAESDGRLRVGDRIVKVFGEKVGNVSPQHIVDRLKAATGLVEIVVTRHSSGYNTTSSSGTLPRPSSASSLHQPK